MAFEGPFEDRLAIHELVRAYADAVTCRDAEAWGALWAEDGVWCLPVSSQTARVEGRVAIVAAWTGAMANFPNLVAISCLGAVTIDGDRATGRAYPREMVIREDGTVRHDTGLYEDEYVKRDGRWLFLQRSYRPLHSA
ncbi:MAG: SgcJ/EcaC family oxidoreductase [Alphaproteobacteria bacterium]|nr:SgcJ/EcaC family oxidoreductase [Alphaproteobacteria bacterium]